MRCVTVLCAGLLAGLLSLPTASPAVAATQTDVFPVVLDDLSPRLAGTPTEVSAVLFAGDSPLSGQQLTLQIKPYAATSFVDAGTATTSAGGYASVRVTLDRSATARWVYAGDGGATYDASTSMDYPVQIAPRVGIRLNDRTLRRGQRFVVRGRTFPAKAGCTVKLWRGELRPLVAGPRPVRLAVGTVRADGTYKLARRFHHKARMRVAVTVAPCAGNARGLSAYRTIRVR